MNTIANFSIWFGQASELKVDTPDRSQPLQRMATRISLISGALGFTILGTLIIMNRLQADLDCLSGGSAIAIPAGTAFLLGACLHWKFRARLPAALPAGHRLARFTFSRCKSAIDLTWILAAATVLCTFLSPLECRGGVGPVVLQDFADWEKQHRGSWIQVTDYDSAAKCFRMIPAVYNEEFAGMAIGYVHSAPNILMWLVFTPSGRFFTAATRELFRWSTQSPFQLLHNQLSQERNAIRRMQLLQRYSLGSHRLTLHLNELDSNELDAPGSRP
jgi:hypothetical protein